MSPSDVLVPRPLRVFCSYSHDDFEFLDQLRRHLAGLVQTNRIAAWDDRDINAGDDWRRQISDNLDRADVIVFLVSENFMASEYCIEMEYERAIEREKEDGVRLMPLLIKPYDLAGTALAGLDPLPKREGRPVAVEQWEPRGTAWTLVSQAIRKLADEHHNKPQVIVSTRLITSKLRKVPAVGRVLGRDRFLDALASSLRVGDRRPVVVSGSGGLGKSTVAAEFARRQAPEFEQVFWMRAASKPELDLDCLVMADWLDLPATGQEDAPREFRKWLEDNSSWLLVLDNAVDAESIANYLPKQIRGHVLITSRLTGGWSEIADEMPLARIAMDDAIELLLEQTGSNDRNAAADLAALLRRHPLSLEKAAADIRQNDLSIEAYVDEYQKRVATS